MSNDEYEYDDYYANGRDADFKPIDFFTVANDEPFDFDALVSESNARIAATVASGIPALLTVEDLAKIEEIRNLHDIALKRSLHRDGHSKSSEGALTITLGTYWDRLDDEGDPTVKPEIGITLYSYKLGPHRDHWFGTIDRALETIRVWYAAEMSTAAEYPEMTDEETEADREAFEKLMSKITVIHLDGSETPDD